MQIAGQMHFGNEKIAKINIFITASNCTFTRASWRVLSYQANFYVFFLKSGPQRRPVSRKWSIMGKVYSHKTISTRENGCELSLALEGPESRNTVTTVECFFLTAQRLTVRRTDTHRQSNTDTNRHSKTGRQSHLETDTQFQTDKKNPQWSISNQWYPKQFRNWRGANI